MNKKVVKIVIVSLLVIFIIILFLLIFLVPIEKKQNLDEDIYPKEKIRSSDRFLIQDDQYPKSSKTEYPEIEDSKTKMDLPKMVIILDDLGNQIEIVYKFIQLDFEIAYSIMPHRPYSGEIAQLSNNSGREVIVHLPLEPINLAKFNPGKGALFVGDDKETIINKMFLNLEAVPFAVGVNNHMGSAFTQNKFGLGIMMEIINDRGLFFIDSKTISGRAAEKAALEKQVRFLSRDIFLDNKQNETYIKNQLSKAIRIAKKTGVSIVIAHPYEVTYRVLAEQLPIIVGKGIDLVKPSRLLR